MIIHYVSGSRADFGLMERCLRCLNAAPNHEIGILVTGQLLNQKYGRAVQDIRSAGLPIVAEIPVKLSGESGAEMGRALASELNGFLDVWQENRPDLVLLLGDRGEMVAGALAAVHLGLHVAHLHGGERSGTLDESFRHAITKLAHLHFPATEEAAERILRMGEAPEAVNIIGAPGLVGVAECAPLDAKTLVARLGLGGTAPLALCVFHPVVQESERAADQMRTLVEATCSAGYDMVILRPNSDAGGKAINVWLDGVSQGSDLRVLTHLKREAYLDLMASSNLVIGNSSSGIIESASFGVPCVNIGTRQNNRQRNANTFDCEQVTCEAIVGAIRAAQDWPRSRNNIYGDGRADIRLLECLNALELEPSLLMKRMTY